MGPVLFYGVPQGCSFGSIVALEWLGEPYQLNRVEMLEQPWDPRFAQVNPTFQTPALLLENNAVMSESIAILNNLGARGIDKGLAFKQGTAEFDQFNQMLAFLNTDYFSSFNPLWAAYEMPDLDESAKQTLRNLGSVHVNKACKYLDDLLEDRQWLLGGSEKTLVDAYFSGVGRWIEYHKLFDFSEAYPNLHRYYTTLIADPAVAFAKAIEEGKDVSGDGAFQGHVFLDALASRFSK